VCGACAVAIGLSSLAHSSGSELADTKHRGHKCFVCQLQEKCSEDKGTCELSFLDSLMFSHRLMRPCGSLSPSQLSNRATQLLIRPSIATCSRKVTVLKQNTKERERLRRMTSRRGSSMGKSTSSMNIFAAVSMCFGMNQISTIE
jgi:hypothetical protein